MKAYRNVAGEIREITIDLDLQGNPILPPDTTVQPRPMPLPGHYVTVVGTEWVQILTPVYVESLDSKRQRKVASIAAYRNWLTEQPVTVGEYQFDADDQARSRLTQALVMHSSLQYLPPIWVTHDNGFYPLADINDLLPIVGAVQNAFAERFYLCSTLRQAALSAATEAELALVEVPSYEG